MTNMQQIRYITQRFNSLQGLRMLPIALIFAVGAVRELTMNTVFLDPPGDLLFRGGDVFGLLGLGLVVASPFLIRRIEGWYRANFGVVKTAESDDRLVLLVLLVLFGASWLDTRIEAISVFGLTAAGLLIAYWALNQRQWHYLAAGGTLLGLSLLPGVSTAAFFLIGAGLITALGLADHLMLVNVLGEGDRERTL